MPVFTVWRYASAVYAVTVSDGQGIVYATKKQDTDWHTDSDLVLYL